MRKILIDFVRNDTSTAASKAESDVSAFLKTIGFQSIYYDIGLPRAVKILAEDYILSKKIKEITASDICFMQYSMFGRPTLNKLVNKLSFNKNKILLVHDIQTLREKKTDIIDIKNELAIFNKIDCLIVHNDNMKTWLLENGVNVPIVSLDIFDYSSTISSVTSEIFNYKSIVFAGNLDKSEFLKKWDTEISVYLYGLKNNQIELKKNLSYLGSQSSTEIATTITKYGFGLVWDGPSINSCKGPLGEYMKYNNPHKTSLYLSSAVPVIIWKESALAPFIEKNKIGITISSLLELDNIILNMSDSEYQELKNNCTEISEKIRHGYYSIKATQIATNILNNKK